MLRPKKKIERVYRSRSQAIVGIVLAVFFGGLVIGKILERPDSRSNVIIGVIFLMIFAFLFGRLAWSGIYASNDGIHVANIFSSFDLKWDEVQRFDIGRWKLLPYVCLIHLRNGGVKHAFGIEESTNFPNDSAKRMTDELNQELASRRPGATGQDHQTEANSGSAQSELFRIQEP